MDYRNATNGIFARWNCYDPHSPTEAAYAVVQVADPTPAQLIGLDRDLWAGGIFVTLLTPAPATGTTEIGTFPRLHNQTYLTVVKCSNAAGLIRPGISDGVLVDTTPPIQGEVLARLAAPEMDTVNVY